MGTYSQSVGTTTGNGIGIDDQEEHILSTQANNSCIPWLVLLTHKHSSVDQPPTELRINEADPQLVQYKAKSLPFSTPAPATQPNHARVPTQSLLSRTA